jgi:hypothetical protein
MSAIQAILLTVALSGVPALLFLGLLGVLRRRQRTPTTKLCSLESGVEIREVTFGDAVRGVLGLQADYTERPSPGEYRF